MPPPEKAAAAVPAPAAIPAPASAPAAIVPAVQAPEPSKTDDAAKGDRITIVQMSSAAFFDSGSATLNESGKTVLAGLASKLADAR